MLFRKRKSSFVELPISDISNEGVRISDTSIPPGNLFEVYEFALGKPSRSFVPDNPGPCFEIHHHLQLQVLDKLINCKYLYICTLILFTFNGCREPFVPDIDNYENILVIDGLITDQPGPHTVRLTRSFSFDEYGPEPEEGAVVMIVDEDQAVFTFTEDQPGIYLSSPSLTGEVGREYKLVVLTADNQTFESEWVGLTGVPDIDSVTYTFEERPTSDPDQSHFGLQVRVNTHDATNNTRYYMWEWTETWEIISPFKSSLYPDEVRCWKTTRSSNISIGTSEHLSSDIIEDYPLYFISAETSKLRIKYSAMISQYSISREAYSYWKSLQDITQNTGSLFDPTPAMVTGNICNTIDPEAPVLGIFQASGVKQERIFIDREEIPKFVDIPSGFSACIVYDITDTAEVEYYLDNDFIFIDASNDGLVVHYIFVNSEVCFRCTLLGSNERPDFWPED